MNGILHFVGLTAIVALGGCAAFQSHPLSASRSLTAFEARSLNTPGLQRYIKANLSQDPARKPGQSWDLRSLTLAAFYYHPALDLARAQWGVARADVAAAGLRPNLGLALKPQYTMDAIRGISPWTLDWVLNLPIETAGKRGDRVAVARHLSDSAKWQVAATAWQVRRKLRAALLNWVAAQARHKLLTQRADVKAGLYRVERQRYGAGLTARPNLVQARATLDQARLALARGETRELLAKVSLARAVGVPVAALDGVKPVFPGWDMLPAEAEFPLPQVQRETLTNRADILAALARYAASQAALRLAIAGQYPDLVIGPGYQWDQGAHRWSLGLSLSLPAFNRSQAEIARAEAKRRAAAARFLDLQAKVLAQLAQAKVGYAGARRQWAAARSLLRARRSNERTVMRKLAVGEAGRPMLLRAHLNTLAAEQAVLAAAARAQHALGAWEDVMQRPLAGEASLPAVPYSDPRRRTAQTQGEHA